MSKVQNLRGAYLEFLLALTESRYLLDDPIEEFAIHELYNTTFIPYKKNDQNRIADALATRESFFDLYSTPQVGIEMMDDMPVSILEVFVSLAVRVGDSIISSSSSLSAAGELFISMFRNMPIHVDDRNHVRMIIESYTSRHIGFDGFGGPFPLVAPTNDQRDTEMWYQMMAYFGENYDTDGKKHSDYEPFM